MLVEADIRGAQAPRLGRFSFCRPFPVIPERAFFFLEATSMNLVWVFGLCAVAMALQTIKHAQAGKPVPQNMAATRVRHSYVQTIHASADKVFAVIEPVAEAEWAPGFEYQWAHARDGAHANAGQEGDVFLTQRHSGLGSQGTAVWVISRRDAKERRVQFVRFIADYQVTQIDVHVMRDGRQSKCEITYAYTALSEHGREALRHITKEHYEMEMKEWEAQVNQYLSRR